MTNFDDITSDKGDKDELMPLTLPLHRGDSVLVQRRHPKNNPARRFLNAVSRPFRRVRRSGARDGGPQTMIDTGYGSTELTARTNNAAGSSRHQPEHTLNPLSDQTEVISQSNANPREHQNGDESSVVYGLEKILRMCLVALVSFMIGATHPYWFIWASRIATWCTVAWFTCVILIFILLVRAWKRLRRRRLEEIIAQSVSMEDSTIEISTSTRHNNNNNNNGSFEDEIDLEAQNHLTSLQPSLEDGDVVQKELPHPALGPLLIVDDSPTRGRLIPNGEPFLLENDLFSGHMVFMVRTPDVDDNDAPKGTPQNESFVKYFREKQRRFEMQFQVKLKKVPEGKVYFACELDEPVKMGALQRAFVGGAMAFVKKMSPKDSFHYSISSQKPEPNGKYEKPHMAFTVENSMDRVVVTKPGDTPPTLGERMDEDAESIKQRKRGGRIDWNTKDTYSFALWSAYFDFLQWKCINLPGIRPFSLASVVGPQHLNVGLYNLPSNYSGDKHYRCDVMRAVSIEISNANHTSQGPATKLWASQDNDVSESAKDRTSTETPLGKSIKTKGETDDMAYEDDDIDDNEAVEELGEGIYLQSGEHLSLQLSSPGGDQAYGFLTCGGGFAVAQDATSSLVVIEKVIDSRKKARRQSLGSKLIRNGDKVTMKLITRSGTNNESIGTQYLSIYRGWWLKWVNIPPPKSSCCFTIHSRGNQQVGDESVCDEITDSYISLGSLFWLRHMRWEGHPVGISSDESPTFGGRMLRLYSGSIDEAGGTQKNPDEEELDENDSKKAVVLLTQKDEWMEPVRFCANLAPGARSVPLLEVATKASSEKDPQILKSSDIPFEIQSSHCSLDIPVWVEMMNRSDRRRQVAFAVRAVFDRLENSHEEESEVPPFSTLRTGSSIASIMRKGLTRRNARRALRRVHSRSDGDEFHRPVKTSESSSVSHKGEQDDLLSPRSLADTAWEEDADERMSVSGSSDQDSKGNQSEASSVHTPVQKRKGNVIGKLARSVRAGTAKTGKHVMKQGRNLGQSTVTAGIAIMSPMSGSRSKKPPRKEPKKVKTSAGAKWRNVRDGVVSRQMRNMHLKGKGWLSSSTQVIAGELAPADQSCSTASKLVSQMSNCPPEGDDHSQLARFVWSQMFQASHLDAWFLQGGASQLGVKPRATRSGKLVHETLTVRCLWESHWREEWCGVYEKGLHFYAPLAKDSSLQLSFIDVLSLRNLDKSDEVPLQGYSIAVVETPWQCYYLAFASDEIRAEFTETVDRQAKSYISGLAEDKPLGSKKARFWLGLHGALNSSEMEGKRKWAKVQSGSKARSRVILNGRRMAFDATSIVKPDNDGDEEAQIEEFVAGLLSSALSITFESMEDDHGAFVNFLDRTSALRSVALGDLDLSRQESVCIFTNLYHCLLQHSLLLTVNGPLHKRSVGHFMRTTCYEIGDDVFSLAELHYCVIRGNMSKASGPKHPYLTVKSGRYKLYALDYVDPRMTLAVNTGDISCPQEVSVLRPLTLDDQLDQAASNFVRFQVTVDKSKKQIMLPKVCDVYRSDFGGDSSSILSFCRKFLDESTQDMVKTVLRRDGGNSMNIKFRPYAEQYHLLLKPFE